MAPKPDSALTLPKRVLPWVLSSRLLLVAIALFLAGLSLGIWKLFFAPSEAAEGLAALNAAYSAVRPVESRISALRYARVSMQRGPTTPIEDAEQRRAELILLDARVKRPTPEVFHALGQFYITQRDFDSAIRELDEAVKATSTNPTLLSDLGAAWLEKGKSGLDKDKTGDPNDGSSLAALGKSLTYINQALTQDSGLPSAIFNRALCFESLLLPDRAMQEWQHYLQLDSSSPWSEEAREHLKLLQQREKSPQTNEQVLAGFLTAYDSRDDDKAWQLVSTTRDDLSGTSVSQQLLDQYLEASTSGRKDDEKRLLEALTYVGDLEATRGDEHYTRDLAALCKSLTGKQKATLIRARGLMKTGYREYQTFASAKEVLETFGSAAKAFEDAGDRVEVNHAKFWIAYALLETLQSSRSVAQLTELAERCSKLNYRWLLMRAIHAISSAKYNLKEYSKSIEYSLNSLALAEQVGDKIGAFNALDLLTEYYRVLNNHTQSLRSIVRSQRLVGCCAFNPIKVWRHYGIVAMAFYSAGLYDAALEYQRESLRRALASGEPYMICLSYAHLGLMHAKLGDFSEALKNAQMGYEVASKHAEESKDRSILAYVTLQLGHLYREANDCENALKNYSESIAIYETLKYATHLFQAHKGRLVCYLKQNNDTLAKAELQTTLEIMESNRATIVEDDNRNKFFEVQQSIYDLAIGYVFQKAPDGREAFQYSEASRARSLLDHIQGRNIDAARLHGARVFIPLSLVEIQQRLPPGNQIVEYTVLEDQTLIWLIDRDATRVGVTRISRAELETRVHRYLQSVSDRNYSLEDTGKQAKELFDLLIRPAEPWLDKQKQLNIVPDKILNALPFNSLISSASGRLLIEDYSISYAPSATVLALVSTEAGTIDPRRAERILAVGNPRLEDARYQFLPNLKDAEREAQKISELYRGTTLLGPAATRQRVLSELIGADVVHFAVHAIEEEQDEMHSRLALARTQTKSGGDDLEAREIYQLKLGKTRLAVLSACQTGSGKYYAGEGTLSLARAFLVAGVPVVVSSLWPVDSQATAELMINFHKIRKQGFSTAEALRRAQLEMLGSAENPFRHPSYWSAFTVLGGSEPSSVKNFRGDAK
ncbi:MAG TPA: CHAT domain-containing tetratricopeptide repeat protein [Pyrinomonadaceae bacterium]|nr:CHAT domain-containing tetratricopeptide repeat protein [Pyrinomonadaceae bacterium]